MKETDHMWKSHEFDQIGNVRTGMIQNISRGRETRRARRESIWIGAFAVVLLLFAAATESMASDDNGAIGQKFQIEVLSSPPD